MEIFVLKKTILTALLLTTPLISSAQNWTYVTGNDSAADFYVDADSIKKAGSTRRFWVLQDMKKPTPNASKSAKTLREIDCTDEKFRSLQYTFFSGKMVTGKLISTTTNASDWHFIEPGSMDKDVMDFVCKK
jgi:hypothetical protein